MGNNPTLRTRSVAVIATCATVVATAGCVDLAALRDERPAPPASAFIADGAPSAPPVGYIAFCLRNIDKCRAHGTLATSVAYDARMARLLASVNEEINRAIRPQSDYRHFGIANVWNESAIEEGAGDCKDYALAKREALLAAGLPEGALRLAIVRTPRNELHAVLTVTTGAGDFVLDNLSAHVRPWTGTPYTWIQRQSAHNPLGWVKVGGW